MENNCAFCGAGTSGGESVLIRGKGKKDPDKTACLPCTQTIEQQYQTETEEINSTKAVLFGLAAAFLTSLLWYLAVTVTNYQLGIAAVAVGWIVARVVMFGSGNKRGRQLQYISVAITLAAMVFSEYLFVRSILIQAMGLEASAVPLFLPPGAAIELVVLGVQNDPVTLLFWGIAAFEAFRVPAKRVLTYTKHEQTAAANQ